MSSAYKILPHYTYKDYIRWEGKWELIEGVPVRDATGTWHHQRLLGRIFGALHERSCKGPWEVLPGFCVQLSPYDVAFPDVLVRPRGGIEMTSCICDDAIIAVEVLSPLTADRDLRWKRQLYPTLPSLQHYVMIAPDDVEVFAYNRIDGFTERRFGALEDILDFSAIDVSIPITRNLCRGKSFAAVASRTPAR